MLAASIHAAELPPLIHAHAHNDYEHTHPLFDALSHGFASVEADIWLVDGQLLVAHDLRKTKPEQTLQSLYLEPLRARAKKFDGKIYPATNFTFHLLIETKSEPNATYVVLRKVLQDYADIVTVFDHGKAKPKAITVVLTGRRPTELLLRESVRLAGLDGHLADLKAAKTNEALLWISDNWKNNFKWLGHDTIPEEEKIRLKEIVEKTHERKLLLRFWNAPNATDFWNELKNDGVDLLNADDLGGLEKFLRQR